MSVVAVTQRVVSDPVHGERRDALAHDWGRYLAGVLADRAWVPVPNVLADPARWAEHLDIRLLILSGGNDLDESVERDGTEARLVEWAAERHRPVLGVCRGLQLINRIHGGTVRPVAGHVAVDHPVEVVDEAIGIPSGARLTVNSFHRFGVTESDLASDLVAWAVSDDGVVEGIRHPDGHILGVQWHPERPNVDQAATDGVVRTFVADHLGVAS